MSNLLPDLSIFTPEKAILELGDGFADPVRAAEFPTRQLRFRNQEWATRVGLGALTDEEWLAHFARFEPLPGSFDQPLALRYHGHQFRSYNPDLGDGRGFLFAQLRDPVDAKLLDLGTKGSGTTPYSRAGDGRLTLKGAVREVLATEMLEALGVSTSKTFSVVETGENLVRHDEPSPTRSAVLVRLSHGHVRYGTFQRLAFEKDEGRMSKLVDYCGRHFYPEILSLNEIDRPSAFLRHVALGAAKLCASWMVAGFVHGVLNTDNMNVTGESFDYGPYRFLPHYDPEFTAAYFDQTGLYAYGRQPESVLWSLDQLAQSLSLISAADPLREALSAFAPRFNNETVSQFIDKLGLKSKNTENDEELFVAAFGFMASTQVPYDQFFHDWYGGLISAPRAPRSPAHAFYESEDFISCRSVLETYDAQVGVSERLRDTYFARVQPCSMLIDEIEAIWEPIAKQDDWSLFDQKIESVREMGRVYGRRNI